MRPREKEKEIHKENERFIKTERETPKGQRGREIHKEKAIFLKRA